MAEDDQGDRSESATPQRLARARDEGHVPISRELSSFAGLGAAALVLMMAGPDLAHHLGARLVPFLARPEEIDTQVGLVVAMRSLAAAVAPMVLAVVLAGAASVLLQTGFLLRPAAISFDLSRISPQAGMRRIFGLDNVVGLGKSLAKGAILSVGAWRVLAGEVPGLLTTASMPPAMLLDHLLRSLLHLMLYLVGAQALFAVLDVLWVRMRHASSLRMSREEIRQERKESDGDPHVKARLRKLRMTRARRRMMAAVPKATVVVTNPTHYAIALAYQRGQQGAPRVVAKGVDDVAARIREVAKSAGVPLVANPPLARALYTVDLDAEIPLEHFKVVAELIAYVWRVQNTALRSTAASSRTPSPDARQGGPSGRH